ncbi:MAG: acetate--CoA ligase [Chlamydiia bacterium]|nr:acetate--CoA ligase [Chlamydiia bacterium]
MSKSVESIMTEKRVFSPSKCFKNQANAQDEKIFDEGKDFETFWKKQSERLEWIKPFDHLYRFEAPKVEWYLGGKLNACFNCLDRHIKGPRKNKAAYIWEGENGEKRTLTYWELYRDVCRFANALKSLGIQKGDRVAIYMPMVPEAVISMLACARIGAIHTVVFGGFSAESLRDRINDCEAKLLITADGGFRRGAQIPLKLTADKALEDTPSIESVIVLKRTGGQIDFKEGRDHYFDELLQKASYDCPPEPMDSEDPLFILYTSGTTGKPKGIFHTTAGYLVGAATTVNYVFDIKEEDVYWCTADVGWITGHTYVVYGPMINGATQVIYEGAPDWPKKDRFWKLIERYGVTIFYTAPTAIRAFMKWGEEYPKSSDLSSLRLLGTVGEPINPEAWLWYYTHIGQEKCPIVDTWWQTETGSIMIAPLPGLTEMKPGSATRPLPGVSAEILNDQGESVDSGYLVLDKPWPSMMRGLWGDPERFYEVYWSKFPGKYFTGDGAKIEDGYYWLLGRVDDVMNVSGHRLGTMEIESALVDHKEVAESAVVGIKDAIKGESPVAFVTLKEGFNPSHDKETELKSHVVEKIGAIARPDRIIFTKDLPKTRSGKIMRRLLRDIAEGRVLGDITTLADKGVVEELKAKYNED